MPKSIGMKIQDLQKAKDELKAAINNLSVPVKANISTQLNHFRLAIFEFEMLGDIPINLYSSWPENKITTEKTQDANRFVLDVATIYRDKTGKKPTVSIDWFKGNKKGGPFVKFLHACAEDIGIDTKKLTKRAQELIAQNEI